MSVIPTAAVAAKRFERRFGIRPEAVKARMFDYLAVTETEHIASLFPRMLETMRAAGMTATEAQDALHEIMRMFWLNDAELRERIEKATRVVVSRR
jgi:hypothetical protein